MLNNTNKTKQNKSIYDRTVIDIFKTKQKSNQNKTKNC